MGDCGVGRNRPGWHIHSASLYRTNATTRADDREETKSVKFEYVVSGFSRTFCSVRL